MIVLASGVQASPSQTGEDHRNEHAQNNPGRQGDESWTIVLTFTGEGLPPAQTLDLIQAAYAEGIPVVFNASYAPANLEDPMPAVGGLPLRSLSQTEDRKASDEECRWLILALTEDFPYADASVDIECLLQQTDDGQIPLGNPF